MEQTKITCTVRCPQILSYKYPHKPFQLPSHTTFFTTCTTPSSNFSHHYLDHNQSSSTLKKIIKMANPTPKPSPSLIILRVILGCWLCSSVALGATYNVVNFGAKSDGKTDSTKAFLNAWAKACASTNPASIYVPQGKFLLKSATFNGKCNNKGISITIDGTLVAPSDYRVTENSGNWLEFERVNGVSIHGGALDGQGTALWDCKNSGKGNCPSGATTLAFTNSNNIAIGGLTSMNSQLFHIVFNGCQNVKLQGVKVLADGNSPNTDGIHIQMSSHVAIINSKIRTGDDCISIGPGTTNLWIENIACGPGHGISIGSLGKDLKEAGVQNVTVKTVTFTGTQNGVRIKTWGRPSNGFVRNVLFQDAIMENVENPVIIDQNYCSDNKGCPGQASGVRVM
ncbi:polygalacturonase [Glycine max]|nr:polygalacturonase [Glycine max]|eukprot:XP_014633058.1 polygalacturonase [Glycine max]